MTTAAKPEPIFARAGRELWRHGLSVIPLGGSDGKHPLERGYNRYADHRASETTIRRWEQTRPSANVGILTGPASGVTVVDIDTKGLPPGEGEALKTLAINTFGDTPLKGRSATGGLHLYFRHHGERGADRFEDLPVDIRGAGQNGKPGLNLIVAPPSWRPDIGGVYEFVEGSLSDLERLPSIKPGAIRSERTVHAEQSVRTVKPWHEMCAGDGRNTALFRHTLVLAARHGSDHAIDLAFCANGGFAEPLSNTEAQRTIESAIKIHLEGKNGLVQPYVHLPVSETEALRKLGDADAAMLWTLLREKHATRLTFAISPRGLAGSGLISGWSDKRYRAARDALLNIGFITRVHEGGARRGDEHLYAFAE